MLITCPADRGGTDWLPLSAYYNEIVESYV